MDQLARLGVIFDQEGAQQLVKALKDVQSNSKGAEVATEQLTDATKKGAAAAKNYSLGADQMSAHLLAYKKHLDSVKVANDNAVKSQRALGAAGLNLGRQFSDVGVSLASGINPLMVLIQQGPQIADGFAVASAAGLSFKTVLTGLWAQVAPLLAAFAPWIAGLAAVGAGVWYLVNAQKKHNEEMAKLNKDIATQKDQLEKAAPWLITNADNANIAAVAQQNFDKYLQKTNASLATYIGLLRQSELARANAESLRAGDNLRAAQSELTRLDNKRRGPSVGGFSGNAIIDPNRSPSASPQDKAFIAQQKVVKDATDASRMAIERLRAAMGVKPGSDAEAFGGIAPPTPRGGGGAGGRSVGGNAGILASNDNSRSIRGVADNVVDPSTVVDLTKINKITIDGTNEVLKTAKDANDELLRSEQETARARQQAMSGMFDNLISLSTSKNKKLAAIGKAAAIAQATMDTYAAAVGSYKALASIPVVGPALGAAAAAAAIAAGLANVAKITSSKGYAAGGYTGNGGIGQTAGVVHGQEFVVNAAATRRNRDTLEAMNAGRAIPKKPAGGGGRGATPVMIVPSPLFDVVVGDQARTVARPIAQQEAGVAAQQAIGTSADVYARRNMKRLA
jgi:hypothetical protein